MRISDWSSDVCSSDRVHAIGNGHGFVTSDISIPVSLGLCERYVDWDYVAHALNFTHLRSARTGIAGVSELLPGCVLTVRRGTTDVHTAWSPWNYVSKDLRFQDHAEAASSIRRAVSASRSEEHTSELQSLMRI